MILQIAWHYSVFCPFFKTLIFFYLLPVSFIFICCFLFLPPCKQIPINFNIFIYPLLSFLTVLYFWDGSIFRIFKRWWVIWIFFHPIHILNMMIYDIHSILYLFQCYLLQILLFNPFHKHFLSFECMFKEIRITIFIINMILFDFIHEFCYWIKIINRKSNHVNYIVICKKTRINIELSQTVESIL